MNANHQGCDDTARDRHEVALRVIREILVQTRVHGDRRIRGDEERVTVGRRLRRRFGADVAARARPVIHD